MQGNQISKEYQQRRRISLLNLPIDCLTMDEAVDLLDMYLQQRDDSSVIPRDNASLVAPCHIVTLNPEIAWTAENSSVMGRAVVEAGLVVPDGIGVVLAARLKWKKIPERVAGFDLMQNLLKLAAEKDYSVFFLGAAPGVAEETAAVACARHPHLRVTGTADGYFKDADEKALLARIAASGTDMLFCALGPPRPAEIWINKHLAELNVGLAMGVGGSFNVMTGRVIRAPLWVQKIGLEWLHRVILEPKRIKRLAAIPRYMWRVWITED